MIFPRAGLRLLAVARQSPWVLRRSAGCAVTRLSAVRWKSTETRTDYEEEDLPNGFLFNEKPLLPGEKRVKEDWENPWYLTMAVCSFIIIAIAWFKPDTSTSAWAKIKAMERLSEKRKAGGDVSEKED